MIDATIIALCFFAIFVIDAICSSESKIKILEERIKELERKVKELE